MWARQRDPERHRAGIGAAEAILREPARAAYLCARFGVTPEQLRHGVPAADFAAADEPR